jgi:hypothetical protein
MSEELDVGPRSLRRALDRFLASIDGTPIAAVRRQLAEKKPPEGS